MKFSYFNRSFICISAVFISLSLPVTGFAKAGKNRLTEPRTTVSVIRQPEGYCSDGQHLVTKLTEPVTEVYPTLPTSKGRPTEPVTTRSRTR
jgi:hypothetical protein